MLTKPNLKAGYPNFYYQCFVKKYCRIKDDFNVNLKNKGGAKRRLCFWILFIKVASLILLAKMATTNK